MKSIMARICAKILVLSLINPIILPNAYSSSYGARNVETPDQVALRRAKQGLSKIQSKIAPHQKNIDQFNKLRKRIKDYKVSHSFLLLKDYEKKRYAENSLRLLKRERRNLNINHSLKVIASYKDRKTQYLAQIKFLESKVKGNVVKPGVQSKDKQGTLIEKRVVVKKNKKTIKRTITQKSQKSVTIKSPSKLEDLKTKLRKWKKLEQKMSRSLQFISWNFQTDTSEAQTQINKIKNGHKLAEQRVEGIERELAKKEKLIKRKLALTRPVAIIIGSYDSLFELAVKKSLVSKEKMTAAKIKKNEVDKKFKDFKRDFERLQYHIEMAIKNLKQARQDGDDDKIDKYSSELDDYTKAKNTLGKKYSYHMDRVYGPAKTLTQLEYLQFVHRSLERAHSLIDGNVTSIHEQQANMSKAIGLIKESHKRARWLGEKHKKLYDTVDMILKSFVGANAYLVKKIAKNKSKVRDLEFAINKRMSFEDNYSSLHTEYNNSLSFLQKMAKKNKGQFVVTKKDSGDKVAKFSKKDVKKEVKKKKNNDVLNPNKTSKKTNKSPSKSKEKTVTRTKKLNGNVLDFFTTFAGKKDKKIKQNAETSSGSSSGKIPKSDFRPQKVPSGYLSIMNHIWKGSFSKSKLEIERETAPVGKRSSLPRFFGGDSRSTKKENKEKEGNKSNRLVSRSTSSKKKANPPKVDVKKDAAKGKKQISKKSEKKKKGHKESKPDKKHSSAPKKIAKNEGEKIKKKEQKPKLDEKTMKLLLDNSESAEDANVLKRIARKIKRTFTNRTKNKVVKKTKQDSKKVAKKSGSFNLSEEQMKVLRDSSTSREETNIIKNLARKVKKTISGDKKKTFNSRLNRTPIKPLNKKVLKTLNKIATGIDNTSTARKILRQAELHTYSFMNHFVKKITDLRDGLSRGIKYLKEKISPSEKKHQIVKKEKEGKKEKTPPKKVRVVKTTPKGANQTKKAVLVDKPATKNGTPKTQVLKLVKKENKEKPAPRKTVKNEVKKTQATPKKEKTEVKKPVERKLAVDPKKKFQQQQHIKNLIAAVKLQLHVAKKYQQFLDQALEEQNAELADTYRGGVTKASKLGVDLMVMLEKLRNKYGVAEKDGDPKVADFSKFLVRPAKILGENNAPKLAHSSHSRKVKRTLPFWDDLHQKINKATSR